MGGSLIGCPAATGDGSAALVPAWQGRGIGRLTPVVVASREAAHLAKVERRIADQVAALWTIAGGGAPGVRRGVGE